MDNHEEEKKPAVAQSRAEGVNSNEELAAMKRDADRYRWLRKQHWNESGMGVVAHPKSAVKLGYDCPSLDRLDAQIDAIMQIDAMKAANVKVRGCALLRRNLPPIKLTPD